MIILSTRHSRPPVILEIDQLLSASGGVGDVELHYKREEESAREVVGQSVDHLPGLVFIVGRRAS